MFLIVFRRWTAAARAIGVAQTRLLMLLIYVTIVLPTGLILRLRSDPLRLKPPPESNWLPSRQEKPTVDRARQQF
jgi:hypothetical protein